MMAPRPSPGTSEPAAAFKTRRGPKAPQQSRCGMQITRGADYAVRVMIHLELCSDLARNTLPSLAQATGAPESFLSKVLQNLCRAGYVTSRRGQVGGFAIQPAGRDASIADVVAAIDGPFRLNACTAPGATCERKCMCAAHPVWAQAQEAMVVVLRSHTIGALACQSSAAPAIVVPVQGIS